MEQTAQPRQRKKRLPIDLVVERGFEVHPGERLTQLPILLTIAQHKVQRAHRREVVLEDIEVVEFRLSKPAASFEFWEQLGQFTGIVQGAEGGQAWRRLEGSEKPGGGGHCLSLAGRPKTRCTQIYGCAIVAVAVWARGCALSYSMRFWSSVRCV